MSCLYCQYVVDYQITLCPSIFGCNVCTSVQQISQLLQEVYELQPKKKFAFKSRKKDNPSPALQNVETKLEEQTEPGAQLSKSVVANVVDTMVGFRNRKSEKLQMNVSNLLWTLVTSRVCCIVSIIPLQVSFQSQAEELRGQDVNLSGLNNCEIRLCGPPSTLHMSKINDCTWVIGIVVSN